MDHTSLSLSRNLNQTLVFEYKDVNGDLQEIRLSVTRVFRKQVRLNIQAPRDVHIIRDELLNTAPENSG
ncbi:MAG: hypothetical protein C9356_14915 [Oleiphilus sp.]|nr:MAG: hypothetical protein C9356_14915 [Oleiphilus sp.]